MRFLFFVILLIALGLHFEVAHAGVPTLTTFQTRITLPTGAPLEAANVNFRFTILDTVGTCALYVEDYIAVNMNASQGVVAFSLGSGSKAFPAGVVSLVDVFNNAAPSFPCQAGGTYIPSATDRRQIVMQFNDGTGWQTLPQLAINSVLYSNYANRAEFLGAFPANDYLRPVNLPTCAGTDALNWDGTTFTCITASGGGGGGVTNVTGTLPIVITGSTSTPVVSMAKATGAINGYLSSADWTLFNGKASSTLNSGQLYLGSGDNTARGVTLSGDATLNNLGVMTLANSGVAAGTYGSASAVPFVTIDAKGRIISATSGAYQDATNVGKGIVQVGNNLTISSGVLSMTSADVTNALGFTPANSAAAGFTNGGNAFSADSSLGSTTNFGLHLKTNNLNRVTINNAGYVGIGTTTPETILHVQAAADVEAKIKSTNTNAVSSLGLYSKPGGPGQLFGSLTFNDSGSSDLNMANIKAVRNDDGAGGGEESDLVFETITNSGVQIPTEKMRLLYNGNVGIGTPDPTVKLDVQSPSFQANFGTGDVRKIFAINYDTVALTAALGVEDGYGATSLTFRNNGLERMRILPNGDVGIGTPSPTHKLEIVNGGSLAIGPTQDASDKLYLYNDGTTYQMGFRKEMGAGVRIFANTAGSNPIFDFVERGTYGNPATDVPRMSIQGGTGNVGIGTTTPGAKLSVVGDVDITGNYKINGVNISAGGGSGTVTSVSSANGDIAVATGSSTPVLTLNTGIGANKIPQIGGVALPLNSLLMSNGATLTGKTCSVNEILRWNATDWVCTTMTSSQWVTSSSDISYTTGDVGIGTVSPSAKLAVVGGVIRSGQDAGSAMRAIQFTDAANTVEYFSFDVAADGSPVMNMHNQSQFSINSGGAFGTPLFTVQNGGNVGIGASIPAVSLDLSGKTDSIRVPAGTTAQRPASPANGDIRVNSTNGTVEAYLASAWMDLTNAIMKRANITSSPYTITSTQGGYYLSYNNAASGTVNLPALSGLADGWSVTVVRKVAQSVTLTPNGADTFDNGLTTLEMRGQNIKSITLMNNGGSWSIVHKTDDCIAGQSCWGTGNIFVGVYNGKQYFTTPGGCTNLAAPTCAGGTDAVTKTWASSAPESNTFLSSSNYLDGQSQSATVSTYTTANAAKYCENMTYGGYTDWYLPALKELSFLYQQSQNVSGFLYSNYYWSSTEYDASNAWVLNSYTGAFAGNGKSGGPFNVRCVRRF